MDELAGSAAPAQEGRPVWAEIDLGAIRHNVQEYRRVLGPAVEICAVVKADAYGHGAVPVARAALQAGATRLAVALGEEGFALRQAGITAPILVLGYTPPAMAEALVAQDIAATVFRMDSVIALGAAAQRLGKTAQVHVKIDTGMSRIGIPAEDGGEFCRQVAAVPGIAVEGIFSHFASADAPDLRFAREQLQRFRLALDLADAAGVRPIIRHMANSAGAVLLPEARLDMIRLGIGLYGLLPAAALADKISLRPAMQLKARIVQLKEVSAGTPVSYGCTFVAPRPSRIATLPLGYADGWSRRLSGLAQVLIRGRRAPLVGRICMDQCMVDVTDIPEAEAGDEALLFGSADLSTDEVAELLGTIHYEVVCMVGKRVRREYRDGPCSASRGGLQ